MKKILAVVLVLAMACGVIPCSFAEEAVALPAVGDTVEGFTVQEIRDFPLLGAEAILFEHDRTGAHLMYIANSDTNRVFDLTFLTRAIDNTGLPHVFEHATLNGSEKYPSTALFFNLMYQTYNTFMNALTSSLFTTYPVASLSEAQLLRYADFYTDSCLHPSILEKESIYREEAWRYRMADMEDELTIEGTVYSEMLAATNLNSMAYLNVLRTAFPGSTIGNESGGDPADIPDMTWEGLKAYHDTFYHPSNCMAYLYGQFEDYTAFLRLLDEAFAPYERREFTFEDAGYTPITEPVEASYAFPVEAGSDTENRATSFYAFVCPSLKDDPREELLLNTLTDLLIADASPFQQELKKALPSGTFASYIEMDAPEDAIVFYAANINPEDASVFKDTVDSVLAGLAETGFAQDLVDGVMNSVSMDVKLSREQSDVGTNLIAAGPLVSCFASTGDPFNYLDYVAGLENMDAWNQEGLYKAAISDWLLNSETTALATTYPEPGLREELDAAEAARLAEVKAGLSEEELQAIIEQTNAEKQSEDASAYVAQLQAVTVASLPEEMREYTVSDVMGEDGIRRLNAQAEVDGVGQTLLLLDAAGLPQEDIHWFALYTTLLGQMDTSEHSKEELASLKTRYLYNGQIRLSLLPRYGTKDFHPYLRAGWIAADEDLATGYDLVYEILYNTQFTDTETLLGKIQQAKATLKSSVNSTPYSAELYRSFGNYVPLYAYYDYFNFLPFYAFLDEAEKLMETSPETVIAKLEEIQNFFHNRANAISAYAGSAEGVETNAALADAFLEKLDDQALEPAIYDFEKPAAREALIVDSAVQYNCIVSDFETIGMKEYTADLAAVSSLISDVYLMPMLREQYGVYTPLHGFVDDGGAYFVSYRDPNITETYQVYEELPAFLTSLETDQETLDGYILSSYSGYAMPEGELTGAITAITSCLSEEPADLKLQYMRELKALTPETLQAYATAYEALMEKGLRFTAGGAAAISAHEDLFDAVLNPFGTVDTSADPATLGDLAGELFPLFTGEAGTPEDAVAFFAENGLMDPESTADMPVSAAFAEEFLAFLSQAIGLPYEADAEATDEPLTKGELSGILNGWMSLLG